MSKVCTLLFVIFLIIGIDVQACVNCNKQLQQGILDSDFFTIVVTLLTILVVVSVIILLLNKVVINYYKKYGQGFLNPAPLITTSVVLGVGLGGFADGIVFHQILQWHEMLSNKLAPATLLNKSINMFWDGIFHLSCLGIVIVGIVMLWKLINRNEIDKTKGLFVGGLLFGWGLFNSVEGIIDHQLVQLHNVKESDAEHIIGNIAFLVFSISLILIGYWSFSKVLRQYGKTSDQK